MYRRNREFGITKTNHIVLVTSVGQTVSSVFRCLSIAGKPYSVSLVCCCSQWLPILLFQVNPSAWISTSGSPATLSVQRKWQTFGRNDANAEHDACHTFRVAFLLCKLLLCGTGASSQPWPLSWAHVSIKKGRSLSSPILQSGISTIGQRQKRVQWKPIPIFDTYVAHVVLTILGLPLGMFFDSSTPCFSQVELASCSASCRSPWVEVCTPRVGKSSPRNELLSAPIGRRNSSKWHFAPWTDMVSFSKSLEFLNSELECQMSQMV